jgi:predicted nucleic acid-binding protein
MIDHGDAHVLASCQEHKAEFLVTLDQKHLLILQDKIKAFKIVSPKHLIEAF